MPYALFNLRPFKFDLQYDSISVHGHGLYSFDFSSVSSTSSTGGGVLGVVRVGATLEHGHACSRVPCASLLFRPYSALNRTGHALASLFTRTYSIASLARCGGMTRATIFVSSLVGSAPRDHAMHTLHAKVMAAPSLLPVAWKRCVSMRCTPPKPMACSGSTATASLSPSSMASPPTSIRAMLSSLLAR